MNYEYIYTQSSSTFTNGFAGKIQFIYDTLYTPSGFYTLYFPVEAALKGAV